MAESDNHDSNSEPNWFTPKTLLVIFCVINMLNYVDRGAIASNGVNGSLRTCTEGGICTGGNGIQGDFNLNYFQDGILSSAFMVGLLLASPIFASLAKSHNPFRLIGVGLSVWTFAAAGCGISWDFWSITIFRMLVGVGEASFISLAAPFIDDNAPVAQKTAWLAIFYMCIPTGIAVGYVYGGLVGGYFNWRFAFFGEAILMLPFVVLGFAVKPLQLKGAFLLFVASYYKILSSEFCRSEMFLDYLRAGFGPAKLEKTSAREAEGYGGAVSGNEELIDYSSKLTSWSKGKSDITDQVSKFWTDFKVLFSDKVYVVNVLGYIAYNFVIGAYSYWGPKAGYAIYHMENADLMFGGVTIVCGIFGTLAGGLILDRMNSTISNAFKLLSGATFVGAIFCFSAFLSHNLYGFLVLFAIGELFVFATQGPVNFVCLHSVKPSLRPLSMAMSTVSIHIFGDVPSSPLVGVVQDAVNNWRVTSLILTSILFISSGLWSIGIFLHSVDRYNEVDPLAAEGPDSSPLLCENAAEMSNESRLP
ncbi:hypothetical protein C5167_016297 [Papaver somniferum]|nr:hypothetical protein C5167_016297 [Papaver somniferum]